MSNLRVALYARYSTDMQSEASVEDQLRVCRAHAEAHAWCVIDSYSDRAISGASMLRPGIQDLMNDAAARRFDLVIAEALDRLSRDQADIATVYKRLAFAGVRIVTIAEGDINEMHIGLKGTMNSLFLKDLALKTHRGLRGRVEAGKSGGGNSFGYEVIRSCRPDGSAIAGERRIIPAEAETVRRIFRDFAGRKSPRAIAQTLNLEKIPSPRGNGWGQSTINGNSQRGTGILNNELYAGRLVWNRLRYIKDPQSGKRVSRLNPPDKLVATEVPDLRIVDEELWQRVKGRQSRAREKASSSVAKGKVSGSQFWRNQRPRFLLTGLMRCGRCGGGYIKINANMFGCAALRNKGTCDNHLNIRVDALERIVIDALRHRMMDPKIFKEFAASFVAERNAIAAQQNAKFDSARTELGRIKSRLKFLVNAIADGGPARSLCDEILALEAREDELNSLLAHQPTAEPFLHPNLAEVYQQRMADLHAALSDPRIKDEAFSAIRTLIDEVCLMPEDGQLRVEIRGALSGILALAAGKTRAGLESDRSVSVLTEQIKLVAGVGFEPTTFRL